MKKGFTLIELLVVVAIIGILATVVLASVNSAQVRANNSAKLQGIGQIQTALTLYYDDNNNYPIATSGAPICFGDYGASDSCDVSIVTSTAATGDADVQAMVLEYMGGTPQHATVTSSTGTALDAFYYSCRNAGCTKYAITYVLDGQGRTCSKSRGLNSSSGLATTEDSTNSNLAGHTYCLHVMDREVPAAY